MQCMYCKGEMKYSTAPLSLDRDGYHVTWTAVPAWVCAQCGEPYFEARQVESIQRMLLVLDREATQLASAATVG
jgi:YgiT-type zinc finger domain-containing protein